MDWKNLTISNIRRLVAALEKADPRLLESLIAREPDEVVPHGRVTMESLLNLLEQTGGSTILPAEIAQQLQQPEVVVAADLVIDCDAQPIIPEQFEIYLHKPGGQFIWDKAKVGLSVVDDKPHPDGPAVANEMRWKRNKKLVLNANVLDWLLQHPKQIPEEWKDKEVHFWSTVYHHSVIDTLAVRYLYWKDGYWQSAYHWVNDDCHFLGNVTVAILKPNQTALPPENVIDCDVRPTVPDGLKLSSHQPGGNFVWDPTKVELFLSPGQQLDRHGFQQSENARNIRRALENTPKRPLNANVLDWLLAHPEHIPKDWKGKRVVFWGTVYSDALGGEHIRGLQWLNEQWVSDESCVAYWNHLGSLEPAAILIDATTQVATRPVIDCSAIRPVVPFGCKLKEHRQNDSFVFDPANIALLSPRDTRKYDRPLNASVLRYLFEHPEHIPEEWKGKSIYFRGTIYEDEDGASLVPHMYWTCMGWQWDCHTMDHPAVWNDSLSRFAVHR